MYLWETGELREAIITVLYTEDLRKVSFVKTVLLVKTVQAFDRPGFNNLS